MRNVKICTVSLLRKEGPQPMRENVQRACEAVESALQHKPDILLLPECYPSFETHENERDACALLDDEWNDLMGRYARQGNCYIINNVLAGHGGDVFNAAFVIGRSGQVEGFYQKTHLAANESIGYGWRQGDELPVFETDFGRIGILICMDIHFPEVARVLALKGAEILFWPTQAFGPSQEMLMTLACARAFDNQVYLACANFCQVPYLPGKNIGRACVVRPDGSFAADTGNRPGIAAAMVDLDERFPLDWGYTEHCEGLEKRFPDWRTLLYEMRRPSLYEQIIKGD